MKKATVRTSSDIALVKYWGQKNHQLILPMNGSISISLDGLTTTTTVEFDPALSKDLIRIDGEQQNAEIDRAVAHLDRLRSFAKTQGVLQKDIFARVESKNSFPKSTGLSSSASGFSALTLAVLKALEIEVDSAQASRLARRGSGSACRCVCGGFVEWHDANNDEGSFAETIFPADYLPVKDLIVVVSDQKKEIGSSEGHLLADSSIFFSARQSNIKEKLNRVRKALQAKDFTELGELTEAEALEFHSILLTSQPPILMFQPATIAVMQLVRQLRRKDIPVYFTMNTGFNVHVLTQPEYEEEVATALLSLSGVQEVIHSGVSTGPEYLEEDLF